MTTKKLQEVTVRYSCGHQYREYWAKAPRKNVVMSYKCERCRGDK